MTGGLHLVIEADHSLLSLEMAQPSEPTGQMSLVFDEQTIRRIVLVAMDEIHGSRVQNAIFSLRPSAVVDLRHAVRFDLPGTSRRRFFDEMEKVGALYVRTPVEWHRLETKPMAVNAAVLPVRLRHEVIERNKGHMLLLVPKSTHLRFIASALNLAMSSEHISGWKLEQVV
ncbi:MAG: hypothetical protein ABW128_20015 [Rhizorhabdus sp.]